MIDGNGQTKEEEIIIIIKEKLFLSFFFQFGNVSCVHVLNKDIFVSKAISHYTAICK